MFCYWWQIAMRSRSSSNGFDAEARLLNREALWRYCRVQRVALSDLMPKSGRFPCPFLQRHLIGFEGLLEARGAALTLAKRSKHSAKSLRRAVGAERACGYIKA